jgi:hypothetical protein
MQKLIHRRISALRAIAWLALGILIGGAPFFPQPAAQRVGNPVLRGPLLSAL